jgi:hypothetical protein
MLANQGAGSKKCEKVFGRREKTARDPADHIGEGSDKQYVRQDPDGVFFHADFSRVVEANSLSTRGWWRGKTRWLFASSLRCLSNGRAEGSIGDESTGLAHDRVQPFRLQSSFARNL